MRDIFIEILTTITHNRLRTALTGFSVAPCAGGCA